MPLFALDKPKKHKKKFERTHSNTAIHTHSTFFSSHFRTSFLFLSFSMGNTITALHRRSITMKEEFALTTTTWDVKASLESLLATRKAHETPLVHLTLLPFILKSREVIFFPFLHFFLVDWWWIMWFECETGAVMCFKVFIGPFWCG